MPLDALLVILEGVLADVSEGFKQLNAVGATVGALKAVDEEGRHRVPALVKLIEALEGVFGVVVALVDLKAREEPPLNALILRVERHQQLSGLKIAARLVARVLRGLCVGEQALKLAALCTLSLVYQLLEVWGCLEVGDQLSRLAHAAHRVIALT